MTPSQSSKAAFFIEQLLLHDFGKDVTERRTEILVLSSILADNVRYFLHI
jgi:hypothetical protein